MTIRIVHPPAGEAPEAVRAAWVGLILPVEGQHGVVARRGVGVVTGPRTRFAIVFALLLGKMRVARGYQVRSSIAIVLLGNHAPEAAAWWRENTPHLLDPRGLFIFQEEACVVEDAGPTAVTVSALP